MPDARRPRTEELKQMERTAREVGRLLGGHMPAGCGFALFVFEYGPGGWLTYMSNAERADMVNALKEFLVRVELGKA